MQRIGRYAPLFELGLNESFFPFPELVPRPPLTHTVEPFLDGR